MKPIFAALALTLVVLVAGCQDKKPVRVTLAGTITVRGQPMKEGILTFVGEGSQVWTALVDQGKFIVTDVAPGPVRVTMAVSPKNVGSSDKPVAEQTRRTLPGDNPMGDYSNAETTPLKFTITADQKTLAIAIP